MAAVLKDSPVGCDGAVSFLPGALHLLEWFCFDNEEFSTSPGNRVIYEPSFVGNSLVRQRIDLGTPILGVPFWVDMEIRYDECKGKGGTVTYKWRKSFGLFKTPQEAFCQNATWNHCNLWKVSCAPYTCDDICTPCATEEVPEDANTEG